METKGRLARRYLHRLNGRRGTVDKDGATRLFGMEAPLGVTVPVLLLGGVMIQGDALASGGRAAVLLRPSAEPGLTLSQRLGEPPGSVRFNSEPSGALSGNGLAAG